MLANCRVAYRLFFWQAVIVHALLGTSVALGEWFSSGDYAVVVKDTSVVDKSRTVATLLAGTNFRVKGVSGDYVEIAQRIDGSMVSGWVKQNALLKLRKNQLAIHADCDYLVRNQGQVLKLPREVPLTVEIAADRAVDVFIIDEDGVESYKAVMKNNGSGRLSSRAAKLDSNRISLDWSPSTDRQYYVLIDNSSFPNRGADAGVTIHYSMAFCIEDPKPNGPESDRGLLIGRVTLDFDNYQGRQGRYRKSCKVIVEAFDTDDKLVKTLEARADNEGYFFIENVELDRQYRVAKLVGSSMEAPVPVNARFCFGVKDKDSGKYMKSTSVSGVSISTPCAEPTILDLGNTALRVNEEGKLSTRIDAAHATLGGHDGSFQVGFGGDGPLDRHEWFLQKFPDSGWSDLVKADRDAVYKNREEKEREKEEKRLQKEAEQRKKAEEETERQEVPPPPMADDTA